MASRNAAERAAFFARREAAGVLRRVLRGDAARRSGGSIKSLVYSPTVRNKRATFALVCETLKYLPVLKEVLASTGVLNSKLKKQEELVYVTAYDILFGQVDKDDMVPDMLVLPPGTDLHSHPLVTDGKVFLQGKASCMVAVALCPKPGWKVRAILLDPSCSGSGISTERLDHLLPSHARGDQDDASTSLRIKKLSAFQKKALTHAISFPSVERVVYSTCSIHQAENEDVVNAVLPLATSLGFELATPFPQWQRRGLPVFKGSEHLLRTDPEDGLEGFFIALFVRRAADGAVEPCADGSLEVRREVVRKRRYGFGAFSSLRLSRMMLW
ncbi:hypothetical protein PR202_gb06612 [Eleusine coracana subsp. coracana]|uniref:SAM-dependent MTase RsmB/NOP-type domain-containing protein n=1 Tax=Eleusine coracana subsp. coracana TaxID=191504 RepID=A0AAV5EAR2_ELECO|nr:hypothetical protein PR202_gb06612 [Eleusine coracana subsp. coracana]